MIQVNFITVWRQIMRINALFKGIDLMNVN